MRISQPSRPFLLATSFLFLVVSAPAAFADNWAGDWEFRVLGQWNTLSDEILTEVDEGPGVYFGFERRLNDRWGIELGLGWNQLDGEIRQSIDFFGFRFESRIESEVEWMPLSIAGNFHLTPNSNFDLYVAGRAGWAFFDDLRVDSEVTLSDLGDFEIPIIDPDPFQRLEFSADDAFFYGLRLGFDRPFGDSGWAFSATLDYTVLELEYDPQSAFPPPFVDPIPTVSVDLDPVTVGVGVSKRW